LRGATNACERISAGAFSRTHSGTNVQPAACIGIAAILAAFILTFATAPKAGAHDAGHPLHHADHHSKWNGGAPNARDISFA